MREWDADNSFYVPPPSKELDELRKLFSHCCADAYSEEEVMRNVMFSIRVDRLSVNTYLEVIEKILNYPEPEKLLGSQLSIAVEVELGRRIGDDNLTREYLQWIAQILRRALSS